MGVEQSATFAYYVYGCVMTGAQLCTQEIGASHHTRRQLLCADLRVHSNACASAGVSRRASCCPESASKDLRALIPQLVRVCPMSSAQAVVQPSERCVCVFVAVLPQLFL